MYVRQAIHAQTVEAFVVVPLARGGRRANLDTAVSRWHDRGVQTTREDAKAMTVRLPRAQAEALEAVAQVDEKPVAEVIRAAIDAHIDARRRNAAFQRKLKDSLERNRRLLSRLAKR